MGTLFVAGSFDDIRSPQIRLLQLASRLGTVRVMIWSDRFIKAATGRLPRFGSAERLYLLAALRYVSAVQVMDEPDHPSTWAPVLDEDPAAVFVQRRDDPPCLEELCRRRGIAFHAPEPGELAGFPDDGEAWTTGAEPVSISAPRRKVVVTGCFDWLHSGHVRFFEEVSARGELYVVVGHDANVRLLKGEGHPRFPQEERRYLVQAVRFVHRALISSGSGWMDAEPEIAAIGADAYAVNEDGDKPEKREFCRIKGLEYIVLTRTPAPGLPQRTSTELRGY
ncbi:MAG: adenylyltransferase/cytidyltransferase family protein [Spirochaetia bacterium]|jgi:cytidyltransferase-like protein